MTDRVKALTVHLDGDYRDDDIAVLVQAIQQMRRVAHVETSIRTADDHLNRERIRLEFRERLWDALNDDAKETTR